MDELPDISRIAYLLSDPARARIVWTLIDGTTRPAGELAYAANISAQSASAHLAKLVRGGLLDAQAHGSARRCSTLMSGAAGCGASAAHGWSTSRRKATWVFAVCSA